MRTTDRQFNLFCKTCGKIQKFYGLQDWEIEYIHFFRDRKKSCAAIYANKINKFAKLTLYKHNGTKGRKYNWISYPDKEIKISAFHEMTHLLLNDLTDMLEGKLKSKIFKGVAKEEHRIINKLQNILLDDKGNIKHG